MRAIKKGCRRPVEEIEEIEEIENSPLAFEGCRIGTQRHCDGDEVRNFGENINR